MSNNLKKNISIIIFILFSSTTLFANSKQLKLISIASKQRMLSQCIAKDYLYIHKNIAVSKTSKELEVSLLAFSKAHKILVSSIKDEDIHNLLEFVELSANDFKETINQPFSLDNAQLILDLSESMLEGSQYVVDSLNTTKSKKSNPTTIVEKQRMLTQRIAKYYIAYQSGIKDENTIRSMKQTVIEFSENLTLLEDHEKNTPLIQKKINEISKLWKIVHKFYNNIEKGGLPLIVFNTTNNISKKMNDIRELYLGVKHKKK
ncbi:MAG: Nitric oxide -responding transcriptional regulator Dnr (Crp/Fnr family) [uncultured Sulfurovum sp.]|uniref:Nitric oxide -responding transcriptional regulator Dnr (Crp/Fnr family) n=1 Tax=uncultured Sulfurovum sp. TaxID=269237 RepID=A0A6S6SN15_9BACT|nr:MAG: Nitric oxide -responding transcriptional regulator Dnr (Crp/Fnr family) [uncultured Sulfurovum sp.]